MAVRSPRYVYVPPSAGINGRNCRKFNNGITKLTRIFGNSKSKPARQAGHGVQGLHAEKGNNMSEQAAASVAGTMPSPVASLEPDAIGVAQDTVIGMASSAPAATVGLSLAALAAATAYGSGPILLLTAIPMLVIANAYRRCNMWNANCGASFE